MTERDDLLDTPTVLKQHLLRDTTVRIGSECTRRHQARMVTTITNWRRYRLPLSTDAVKTWRSAAVHDGSSTMREVTNAIQQLDARAGNGPYSVGNEDRHLGFARSPGNPPMTHLRTSERGCSSDQKLSCAAGLHCHQSNGVLEGPGPTARRARNISLRPHSARSPRLKPPCPVPFSSSLLAARR